MLHAVDMCDGVAVVDVQRTAGDDTWMCVNESAGVWECGADVDVVRYCRWCMDAVDGARERWMFRWRFVDECAVCVPVCFVAACR